LIIPYFVKNKLAFSLESGYGKKDRAARA